MLIFLFSFLRQILANLTSLGLKQLILNFKPPEKFREERSFFSELLTVTKDPNWFLEGVTNYRKKVLAVKCSVVKLQQSGLFHKLITLS